MSQETMDCVVMVAMIMATVGFIGVLTVIGGWFARSE